ncbi:type II toxin-antitoxin system CcdA family antitoxin [Roseovarius sp. A-2]|uniref:type II toxin-antitoxin system CcdA family antitoxin n=1 Tax=Roseovarius sp. A-2 TaxID=1570360 RepID=UPI0020CB344F|nr:type II toxin-antitoxin system CcdA family antitoxin [Roseovarius sp. A-2]
MSGARAMKFNVSFISEAALAAAVQKKQARAWGQENAEAIQERRSGIEGNALPLADHQILKND